MIKNNIRIFCLRLNFFLIILIITCTSGKVIAEGSVIGYWPVVTSVEMKYINSETVNIIWHWENIAVTMTESEAAQSIDIDGGPFLGSFFLNNNGNENGLITDLSTHAPAIMINNQQTWGGVIEKTRTISGGKASYVSALNRTNPPQRLCIGFGLLPQQAGVNRNYEHALPSNTPAGLRILNRCLPVPAAAEWCLTRDSLHEFDFGVLRTNQAEGRYRTLDIRIDCTDEMTFSLRLDNGTDRIPLNNGMQALLTLNSTQNPLTTPIRGMKGLNLASLNATLQGKPLNDGPFSGKGVLFIEYP